MSPRKKAPAQPPPAAPPAPRAPRRTVDDSLHFTSPLPLLPTFGARLAYARKLSGLSQSQLAEAIGRARGVMVDLETDRRDPSRPYVEIFARLLRVPVEWLDGAAGDSFRVQAPAASPPVQSEDPAPVETPSSHLVPPAAVQDACTDPACLAARSTGWLVDLDVYRRVMASQGIDELRTVLSANPADCLTIALPIAGGAVMSWREAQSMQTEVRERVREILARGK